MSATCQCEHVAHDFTGRHPADRKLTPLGNYGHRYTVTFLALVEVKTVAGTFHVCQDCADDCLHASTGMRKATVEHDPRD